MLKNAEQCYKKQKSEKNKLSVLTLSKQFKSNRLHNNLKFISAIKYRKSVAAHKMFTKFNSTYKFVKNVWK